MTLEELRAYLGPGPAYLVQAWPVGFGVYVAAQPISLETPGPSWRNISRYNGVEVITAWDSSGGILRYKPDAEVNPRIDLACITTEYGPVQAKVFTGTPAVVPIAPALPEYGGWIPVAEIFIPPNSRTIQPSDIKEIHP